jgi:hypothetical protein
MAELIEILRNLPTYVQIGIAIPPLLNIWAICHAGLRVFPGEQQERLLWVIVAMLVPFLGGIIYLLFGFKRSRKPQTN